MVIKGLARALATDFTYTRLSRTFFLKGFKRLLKKFWDLKTAGQFLEWTRSRDEKPFTFQRLSLHRRFCLHFLSFPKLSEGTGGHSCLDATELCDAGQAGQPGGDGARYCGHHRPGLIRTPGLPLLHRPPTLHPWGAGSLNEAGKAGAA